MIHTFIKNQRRAISREFTMGRRNQTVTGIIEVFDLVRGVIFLVTDWNI